VSETFATVLSVEQLAKIVHKSPSSIRSDASRNPGALPPICRIPGTKRLLWRIEDVQAWLAAHVEKSDIAHYAQIITAHKKGPGRPRKTAFASTTIASSFAGGRK
jgi:hypothetical protein